MMPLIGFLPPEDVRIAGAVAAIERELMVDGSSAGTKMSRTRQIDGLSAGVGVFLLGAFWLTATMCCRGAWKTRNACSSAC